MTCLNKHYEYFVGDDVKNMIYNLIIIIDLFEYVFEVRIVIFFHYNLRVLDIIEF